MTCEDCQKNEDRMRRALAKVRRAENRLQLNIIDMEDKDSPSDFHRGFTQGLHWAAQLFSEAKQSINGRG